jgi:hypothetical protein
MERSLIRIGEFRREKIESSKSGKPVSIHSFLEG